MLESELHPMSRRGLVAVLALAAVPFLFGLSGGFVYDDELLIAANPVLQDLARLPELLSSSLWGFMTTGVEERVDYWRPLSWIVLAVAWAVGNGAPLAFKLVSLALHLGAVAATAGLARRVSGRGDVALATALLFGVHPLGVEAVTWISAVNDPLMAMCALLGASSWIDWRRSGSRGLPWRGVVWLALAMLAKEAALAFVFVPLVLDATLLCNERRAATGSYKRTAAALLPWLLAYWLVRVAVFGVWHGGLLSEKAFFDASPLRLIGLRIELLGGALGLIAWPAALATFRPFRPQLGLFDAQLFVPLILLVLLAAALIWSRRRDERLFFGLAWAALVLALPALRVQSLGQFPLSDRFVYVAVPGAALALVLALRHVTPLVARPRALGALVLLIAAALGTRAALRTRAWHDPRTFWDTAALESPDVASVWWNLGRLELDKFRSEPTLPTAQRARDYFVRAGNLADADRLGQASAAVMSFDVLQANIGLGFSLLCEAETDTQGDVSGAALVFDQVVRGRPDSFEAWGGRGIALVRKGDMPGAIESLTRALEINPNYALAHFNMGMVRLGSDDWVKARNHFERCFELDPSNTEALLWAARAAVECHDIARGRELAERALVARPRDSGPSVLLGILDRRDNELAHSLEHFENALLIDPNDGKAHNERAKTLGLLGRFDDALTEFVEACRLGHDHFEPHYNVAALLIEAGASNDALLPYLQRAYELCPDPATLGTLRGNLESRIPKGDPLRSTLALFDERRGAIDSALEWAASATEGDDADGSAAYVYGRLLLVKERPTDALVWLGIANERRPDDFLRLRELGTARAACGDADGARAAWTQALEVLPQPRDEREVWLADQMRAEIESGLKRLDAPSSAEGAVGARTPGGR